MTGSAEISRDVFILSDSSGVSGTYTGVAIGADGKLYRPFPSVLSVKP